jgi:hypothetical protein
VAAIYWVFSMPRSARIDTPEAHHHIVARGIDRRKISDDDADRDAFLERLGAVLSQSGASCYAWALIQPSASPFCAAKSWQKIMVSSSNNFNCFLGANQISTQLVISFTVL